MHIVEVEVNFRPTVSRPVCLGVGRPSGTRDQFFFLLEIPLDSCGFVILYRPLWREDVSVIYCTIASRPCQSSHSWVEVPQNSTTIFYCLIWDSPNLEGQVPVFISPRNRVAQLYPRALGSLFVTSYDSQGYGGVILTRVELSLSYGRRSVDHSSWYRAPFWSPWPDFILIHSLVTIALLFFL
jgi:hypothetical protein